MTEQQADHQLWIEKYRPQTFAEVKGHTEITKRLQAFVEQKNIPHLLFSGPAGVGKTTLSLIIAKTLFGDNWHHNFLELNASDSRGIEVIRETVKDFARTKALGTELPKIILLDECDALTKEAQQALRRTMETYTRTARFILSANFSSKIIDPIQSRCTIFRFKPLSQEDIKNIIMNISKREGLKIDDKTIAAVSTVSKGDARRAENILQSCSAISKTITEKLVYEIVSAAHPEEMKEVLQLAVQGSFIQARDKLLDVMLKHGLSGEEIVKQIQETVWDLSITDQAKMQLIEKCGEIEFRMVEGSDEFIQLEALLASFVLAKK
ncbi:replication factor C small subunit [Candidatus Woesearchaeota archaeon]|nr:replication factor C small subunit [Candidatus Woesearchaeota archaeon]